MIIIVGEPTKDDVEFAAKVTARYCKGKDEKKVKVKYGYFKAPMDKYIEVEAATEKELVQFII